MITSAERTAADGGRPYALARRAFFVGFAAVYLLWLVLGMVDTLVWEPQYVAPTTPLDRIYQVLTDAGSARGVVASPVLWLLFWAAIGAAYLIVFLPAHPKFDPVAAAVPLISLIGIGLIVFGAMAFFEFWSGFAMGMEVSDDLPPGVGASTPFSLFCLTGGFLIALGGGALWAASLLRAARLGRRPPGTSE